MLRDVIKESFNRTNNCLILAAPLVLFVSMIIFYAGYVYKNAISNSQILISLASILIMTSACASAWFYMAKKTVAFSDKIFIFEKDQKTTFWKLLNYLPTGVGRYFLSFLVALFLYFVFCASIGLYLYDVAQNSVFSNVDFSVNYINLNLLYVFCILSFLHFFLMFWIPEMIYCEKNPFKAYIYSLRKLWITLPKSLILFLYFLILIYLVKFLDVVLLLLSPYLYFFVLLLGYYLAVYIVVVVFSYYERNFVQ